MQRRDLIDLSDGFCLQTKMNIQAAGFFCSASNNAAVVLFL